MPKASLATELERYRIGQKVRRLRRNRALGLVELGRLTGLSPAMLSKIETGKSVPTLSTLARVAIVFSVGLDHFFRPEEERPVCAIVRRRERMRFPEESGSKSPSFWFESLDFPATDRAMSAYVAEIEPQDEPGRSTHQHEGYELLYVIEGTLGLWHDGIEHRLDKGDSVYLDARAPHGYRRLSSKRCTAIVVTAP
ncbi:MAG TPA: cupin domain-containing protein [Candidatus Limnocylindrales bacterium]|nr:cupin domain-containing protein [Candidatus Limnocylindrales bacterium]